MTKALKFNDLQRETKCKLPFLVCNFKYCIYSKKKNDFLNETLVNNLPYSVKQEG